MGTLKYDKDTKDFLTFDGSLAAGGELPGIQTVFKFGHNPVLDSAYAVISEDGFYRTPIAANATTLRVKAGGSVADDASGVGARAVTFIGIGADGTMIIETVPTAGVSASISTSQLFMRLFRAFVSECGTYSVDMSIGSHAGDIVIENTAGTQEWAKIIEADFPEAQTQIAAYSFGTGIGGYLHGIKIFVEATKLVDMLLVTRSDFMNATTGIQAVRLLAELKSAEGDVQITFDPPLYFSPHSDVALLAKTSAGNASVNAQMSFVLNNN